jgi:hypothetical protein
MEELPETTRRGEGVDNRSLGIAIGGVSFVAYAGLAFVLAIAVWTLLSVYAIVKWVGSAPEAPDPAALIVGVVGLVTLLVVLIAVAIGFVGRSLNPKKIKSRS